MSSSILLLCMVAAAGLAQQSQPVVDESFLQLHKRGGPAPQEASRLTALIEEATGAPSAIDRAAAVWLLASYGPAPEVLAACRTALKDESEEVRLEAVQTLEFLMSPSVWKELYEAAAHDSSSKVREASDGAIHHIFGATREARVDLEPTPER